jgi:hypothetical protein
LLRVSDEDRALADAVAADVSAAGFVQQVAVEPATERAIVVELGVPETAGESRP